MEWRVELSSCGMLMIQRNKNFVELGGGFYLILTAFYGKIDLYSLLSFFAQRRILL